MDDMAMVDFVIYAMKEDGDAKGSEVKGSVVKLMRFPADKKERLFGRFSGPWEDLRLGLHNRYERRRVGGSKTKAAKLVLEPVEREIFKRNVGGVVTEVERLATVDRKNFGLKLKQEEGTINRGEEDPYARFSEENEEYLRKVCLHHFQYGTMRDLEDETGDAVYMEELPKLKLLIGRPIWWEFRPYIRTARGAASGVDDYKLEIVSELEPAKNVPANKTVGKEVK